ncbi:unnamed protein product [Clavelina lepadiformis]|uniref:EGF-like domain-containing protein n=1 Tax=Clavelina lepadiformis TaxID=159417 RepID=A0ABP0EYI3_CLALP
MKAWTLLLLVAVCAHFDFSSAWRRRRRRACDTSPCQWVWGSCSQSCGGGTQSPTITRSQGSCGSCNLPAARSCNNNCCPRSCQWASWGSWGSCSAICGLGTRTRSREYAVTASCGGSGCPGLSTSSTSCNNGCCPVNCVWGPWTSFETCSVTCGGGMQSRSRSVTTSASCGGSSCSGLTSEIRTCNTECCPVECVWGPWSDFSSCSVTCGGGTQSRFRNILHHASCGGSSCSGSSIESNFCNTQCCPVDCVWGEWGEWNACSISCGSGIKSRSRSVKTPGVCGGKECIGETLEKAKCNDICCPVDCKWSDWSEWGRCDRDCGGGIHARNRTIVEYNSCGGLACEGPIEQSEACNEQCCPVNCEVSPWTSWSDCSAECGPNGTSSRKRDILVYPLCGGMLCPTDLIQDIPCNRFCFNGEVFPLGCSCWPGWRGECCEDDINECEEETGICHRHAVCVNTHGSFGCGCVHGYTGNGTHCSNMDECALGIDNCDLETTKCVDTEGSFKCDCLGGYTENKVVCRDIDECSTSFVDCHINATCLNRIGSFDCECKTGFTGNGILCEDVEECLTPLDECKGNSVCRNTVGGYWCDCGEPYKYKNGECVDRAADSSYDL